MNGYIQIDKSLLSTEEYDTYQAYRCGLCRCLYKKYGRKGQLMMNSDMVFPMLLLSSLYELDSEAESFLCAAHPGHKKNALMNEAVSYFADMTLMTAYHNLQDDCTEDRNPSNRIMSVILRKAYHDILKKYPRQAEALTMYMQKMTVLATGDGKNNLEKAASLAGDLLAEIYVWKDDRWQEEMRTMGFYMGRFLYLIGVYDGLGHDGARTNNPFIETSVMQPDDYETISRLMLMSMITECVRSFDRMPILQNAGIIRNILRSGIWIRYEQIRERHLRQKEKEQKKQKKIEKKIEKLEKKQKKLRQQANQQ